MCVCVCVCVCNLNAAVLVHMQCNSVCETAQQDLQSATRALFYNEQDKGLNIAIVTEQLYV